MTDLKRELVKSGKLLHEQVKDIEIDVVMSRTDWLPKGYAMATVRVPIKLDESVDAHESMKRAVAKALLIPNDVEGLALDGPSAKVTSVLVRDEDMERGAVKPTFGIYEVMVTRERTERREILQERTAVHETRMYVIAESRDAASEVVFEEMYDEAEQLESPTFWRMSRSQSSEWCEVGEPSAVIPGDNLYASSQLAGYEDIEQGKSVLLSKLEKGYGVMVSAGINKAMGTSDVHEVVAKLFPTDE